MPFSMTRIASFALASLLLQAWVPSHAEGIIDIHPYVNAGISYDDNLFRFSNSAQAVASFGSDATSDVVRRASAGVLANIRLSLQLISLEVDLNQNRYNRFSLLDSDTSSEKAIWNWHIGSTLGGELSARREEAVGGFTEVRNPVLNIQTTDTERATINWEFIPDWRLHASAANVDFSNSIARYMTSNREDTLTEVGIEYLNRAGNLLGLAQRNVESTYPNRDPFSAAIFGSNNQQQDIVLDFGWWPSVKTHLSGEVGRAFHEFDGIPQRNFNTWNRRVTAEWYVTGKSLLSISARQETGSVDDLVATYVQTHGLTIAPVWNATSKINVRGQLTAEKRSYLGNSGLFIGAGAQREDKVRIAGLFIDYTPYDKVQIQATYQREHRSSNIPGISYDDNTLGANLRIDFNN